MDIKMFKIIFVVIFLSSFISCSGSGGSDENDKWNDKDTVDSDNSVTDADFDEIADDDVIELPIEAANNCDSEISTITKSGEYSFDTSSDGFTNDYSAICSNYINGRDAVYRLKITKLSRVVVKVIEAPDSDSTVFIGTECGMPDIGCNDDIDKSNFLSHLILDLETGDYYLVFDSVDQKENEESKGVFKFTVQIDDNPCAETSCSEADHRTCVNDDGAGRCICLPGYHEEGENCVETECTEIELNEIFAAQDNGAGYDYGAYFKTVFGDANKKDVFLTRFIGEKNTGNYKLGEGNNKNLSTCSECVMAVQDNDEDTGAAKQFFAVSGNINIEKAEFSSNSYMSGISKGSLSGVKMYEITTNTTGSWDTLYAENGSCLKIKDIGWDTYCYPSCETENGTPKICGSDGCGGICGEENACNGVDEQCSADGTKCEAYSCTKITPERIWFTDIKEPHYSVTFSPSLGDSSIEDNLVLALAKSTSTGVHDLAEGNNKLLSECTECVVLMEDLEQTPIGLEYSRFFFQQKGKLYIDEIKPNDENTLQGQSKGRLEGVRLINVLVNHSDNSYLPVQGGECVEIVDSSWDTFCTPSCKAEDGSMKICGDDGCGGSCGSCNTDEWCSDDQLSCEKRSCTKITAVNFTTISGSVYYNKYEGTFSPSIGDSSIPDTIKMSFGWLDGFSAVKVGTYDLGSAENSLNRNSNYLVTILEDYPPAPYAKEFAQESGTMTIIEIAPDEDPENNPPKGSKGKLENVILVEVSGYNMKKVEKGACYEIESANWNLMP